MSVHQIYTESPLRNYNYIVELDGSHVAVVDPLYPEQINDWLTKNSKTLSVILLSHGHHDHVGGVADLLAQHDCELWGHRDSYSKVDRILEGEEIIKTRTGEAQVIYTPGHTMDHLCFLFFENGKQKEVITMDTIFNAGIGNCKNGGEVNLFAKTIIELNEKLEDQVRLYPGHDYIKNNLEFTLSVDPDNQTARQTLEEVIKKGGIGFHTTLELERKINLFLKTNNKEEIINLRSKRDNW